MENCENVQKDSLVIKDSATTNAQMIFRIPVKITHVLRALLLFAEIRGASTSVQVKHFNIMEPVCRNVLSVNRIIIKENV